MATRVIIVRHGQSTYNAQQRIQGRCDDSVLTEKGRQDALKVAEALQGVQIDAVYHSPLQRAAQTAHAIVASLQNAPPPQASAALMEIDLPLWEGLHKSEMGQQDPDGYRCWKQRPHEFFMNVKTPEGEDRQHYPVLALYEQAKTFWQTILPQHPNQTLVIIAHNGINRCLLMSAIGIPAARYHTIQQSNCSINVLNFAGGLGDTVQLESLNQVSHMGITLPPPRPPENKLRLLLVRHGETEWNRMSRFQGTRDIPLNEKGKFQAQQAADYLKDIHLDFAVSSPMLRPKETAEIILQHHPHIALETHSQLEEIGHGLWEGKFESEIEDAFPGMLDQWKNAPETVQMPEGENLQQVWDRAILAWEEIAKKASASPEPQVGLVVAHDAINKVILCYLLGLEPKNFWNIKQGNGAVSVIDYPKGIEGLPVLQTINLTTYLGSGILDKTAAGAL